MGCFPASLTQDKADKILNVLFTNCFSSCSHKGNSIPKVSEIFRKNFRRPRRPHSASHKSSDNSFRKYDLFITCVSVCFLPKLPTPSVAVFSECLRRTNYLYRWLLKMKHPSELKLEIVRAQHKGSRRPSTTGSPAF